MKNKITILVAAIALLSTLNLQLSPCFAQGALTPPGPPGATMLTLSQIEPRTPIASAPFIITNSGSYYLTTNLLMTTSGSAVGIYTNGVTLDLSGFTISSTFSGNPVTAAGIVIGVGYSDITIYNGHITSGVTDNGGVFSGPGFPNGIGYLTVGNNRNPPANVHVANLSVSGCWGSGIELGTGNSSIVESCTVQTVGGNGIEAAGVFHSTALVCGGNGIIANNASDCYGYSVGSGESGVYVSQTAANCYGYSVSSPLKKAGFSQSIYETGCTAHHGGY
jgi:hypothetical protein